MLRAVRFAARFECSIAEETADVIRANAEHLSGVSRERIGEEVKRMMRDKSRGVAAWELQYLGLDARVLREDHCLAAPTRLGRLPEQASYPATLAAWLLDRYPDETCKRLTTIAKRWVESLVLSNHDAAALIRIIEIHDALLHGWEKSGVAKQKRLASEDMFEDALSLVQADDRPLFVDLRRRVQELPSQGLHRLR